MGVPGFVSWLRDYCKDAIILNSLPNQANVLYIDGNCLIHPKCFEVVDFLEKKHKYKDYDHMVKIMFQRIVKFIDYLVCYVNPQECYFAVDGVAPMAKINQQRKRRYRAIDDTKMKNDIKEKHKIPFNNSWSNTVITPGTDFMEDLHDYLLNFFNNKKNTNIKYTYSSYHSPGEGEHKILGDIKSRKDSGINVIYGLDADLFFLAMASQHTDLYLLREEHQFRKGQIIKTEILDVINDVAEDMRFVSIDYLKEIYNQKMEEMLITRNIDYQVMHNDNYWNDFIFLCYFLGNDFLPHIPSLDIHKGGLDVIIDAYVGVYSLLKTNFIIRDKNNVAINMIFMSSFLEKLSSSEDTYFLEVLPSHEHKKRKKRCPNNDEYSKELWMIENMMFYVEDPIKLGHGSNTEWKSRYYSHYFNVSEYYDNFINDICKSYMEGLIWITKYYFNECPSWDWQYPYTHAPFVSDLNTFLKKTNTKFDINKFMFNLNTKPLDPCVQLLAVLPPSCANIMPPQYGRLVTDINSPILDIYPTQIKIDMINKDKHWMCIPFLCYVDTTRILDVIKDIKISQKEETKNKICKEFKVNH